MCTCQFSFGWIMCSPAQHASFILSPLLMPTRLYQISLSPSPCLCFPFPSPTSFYSHKNVWYVDQQTGCVIFPLSSEKKLRQGRGGEKQPYCHLHSCILHHPSSQTKGRHTPNLDALSPPSLHILMHVQFIWEVTWNRITDHVCALHRKFSIWVFVFYCR